MKLLKMKKHYWLFNLTNGKPIRFYVFFCMILLLLFLIYLTFVKPKHNETVPPMKFKAPVSRAMAFKGARIVHIDLKGAPLKISYYKHLFPLLVKLGATGVLMEYEDMFPYNSTLLRNVSALNAYSLKDIKYVNRLAVENNLEIIPLVQTFGHLEFLLKLEGFVEFREVPEYPQVICPTHSKAVDLIMEIVEQVIDAHPTSNYIHVGADEVYYLGFCERCANIMTKMNLSRNQFFMSHINAVSNKIHSKYPDMKILMWDDEFRSFKSEELNALNDYIQPVVWKYSKDVSEDLGPSLWENYSKRFFNIWIASAFKGATGSNQYVSDVSHYVQNHRSWLQLMSEYQSEIHFSGIIITGWQRYDHFAILCELLPVAIPSLAMSLRVIMGFEESPLRPPSQVAKILGCEQPYALMGPAFGSPRCSFPGGDILEVVLKLHQLKQEYDTVLEDGRVKGWFSEYNKRHTFSNPNYVQTVTAPLPRIKMELKQIDNELSVAMDEVYDSYTINEFREIFITPFLDEVTEMVKARNEIMKKNVWPKRPLL